MRTIVLSLVVLGLALSSAQGAAIYSHPDDGMAPLPAAEAEGIPGRYVYRWLIFGKQGQLKTPVFRDGAMPQVATFEVGIHQY